MPEQDDAELQELLRRAGGGDAAAASQLFELLHPNLRLIAGRTCSLGASYRDEGCSALEFGARET